MANERVLVNNAGDRSQLKAAKRSQQNLRADELNDVRAVLALPAGRRFIWRLLEHCSVFTSIYDSSSKIYANAARQDVGHFVMAEIGESDEDALLLMMKEARDNRNRRNAEIDSERTNAKRDFEENES